MTQTNTITDSLRSTLARVADVLIPAAEGMPAASEVNVSGAWLEHLLLVRPDLTAPLAGILKGLEERDPEKAVRLLERDDPKAFDALLFVVAGAYFMADRVRATLGYPGQEALTLDVFSELSLYIEEGLLDPVLARGHIYRDLGT